MKKVNKKNSRKNWTWLIVLAVIAVAGIAVALIVGFGGNDEAAPSAGTHYVQIDIADYGTITAELDGDTAPITVANFVELVKSGFYDGLTFHRIISGFMIQGGDPNGNGTGGSANKIKGEFALTASRTISPMSAGFCPWPAPARLTAPAASSSSCTTALRISTASMPLSAECSAAWRLWTPSAKACL